MASAQREINIDVDYQTSVDWGKGTAVHRTVIR